MSSGAVLAVMGEPTSEGASRILKSTWPPTKARPLKRRGASGALLSQNDGICFHRGNSNSQKFSSASAACTQNQSC